MTATKIIALTSALALMTACTTPTGERDHTRSGLLAGAATGALLGIATGSGNRVPEAVIGAGLGAMAGGAIGQHLDRQAEELRGALGSDVGVVNTGSEIVVTMPQDILFETDSAALRSDLRADLVTIAASLQRYPDTTVFVTGHTDSTGTAGYNQRLSERRADAVASVLLTNGVPRSRVLARGAGQSQPIASNDTASGRAQNRRVEITIRPNG